VKGGQNKADLNISSYALKNPIKMKMDWNPMSNFEKILIEQIEEAERREFAEEEN
jgi:hypothetical protein